MWYRRTLRTGVTVPQLDHLCAPWTIPAIPERLTVRFNIRRGAITDLNGDLGKAQVLWIHVPRPRRIPLYGVADQRRARDSCTRGSSPKSSSFFFSICVDD